MDKKKLVKYTQWLLFEMEITPIQNKKLSKKIVNEFLKKYPEFLDETDKEISDEIDQEFESLNDIDQNKLRNNDNIPEADKFWDHVNIDGARGSVKDLIRALNYFDEKPNEKMSSTYPFNWYVVSQNQGTPHRCPICNGSGIVSPGFYNSTSGFSTSNASSEPCRQCCGTGIIWSK